MGGSPKQGLCGPPEQRTPARLMRCRELMIRREICCVEIIVNCTEPGMCGKARISKGRRAFGVMESILDGELWKDVPGWDGVYQV